MIGIIVSANKIYVRCTYVVTKAPTVLAIVEKVQFFQKQPNTFISHTPPAIRLPTTENPFIHEKAAITYCPCEF